MDREIEVGDKVILSYVSRFGTGRNAVASGAVNVINDDGVEVQVGLSAIYVKWDLVNGLRLL